MSREAAHVINLVAARLSTTTGRAGSSGDDQESQADHRRDARLLLGLAMRRDDPVLPHEDITLTADAEARLEQLIHRRKAGEPVSRLRGWREFYSLPFQLSAATLDPRPDSEVIVDTAIDLAKSTLNEKSEPGRQISVIDFGTGTGCLLLAILHHLPTARGIGVDISAEAIDTAAGNAERLGLASRSRWQVSNWDQALADATFDLVISNPPYIPDRDIDTLAPEVRLHDPRRALDGGEDGLVAWRQVLPVIARRLNLDGRAVVEIGYDQAAAVTVLAKTFGLEVLAEKTDLGGRPRCLIMALASG